VIYQMQVSDVNAADHGGALARRRTATPPAAAGLGSGLA
jgi:hypothetical protein